MAAKTPAEIQFNGERGLVVIFKPEVGLRATGGEVAGESRPNVPSSD